MGIDERLDLGGPTVVACEAGGGGIGTGVSGGSSARPSLLDADNLPVFVQNRELRACLLGSDG